MDFQVIAESRIHHGRRLLIGSEGGGYIQLDGNSTPLPVSMSVFARLRAMTHYRSIGIGWNAGSGVRDGLMLAD